MAIFRLGIGIIGVCFCTTILAAVTLNKNALSDTPHTVSIIVLGRKGSGVTSTLRQLLGPKTVIHEVQEAVASTDILEYTIKLQPPVGEKDSYFLKLVDVPGLDIDEITDHDCEILANLKTYLQNSGLPAFFLVVNRFDDIPTAEQNPKLVKLLKRAELIQRALFHSTTDNTLFLFSRLLNENAATQQSPNERIVQFRTIIQNSTSFPSPIEIVVGDNKPDADPANNIQTENGFYKLPNNELYPKNIWDKLDEIAEKSIATQASDKKVTKFVIKSMVDSREKELHTQELVPHPEDEETFENDLKALHYLIAQDNINVPCNEVQRRLHHTCEKQEATTHLISSLQLLCLQMCLRNMHIEKIEQLPQTLADQVKFFQMGESMTGKYSLLLLEKAFNMYVPDYPGTNFGAGYGYNLVNDQLLLHTPFDIDLNPLKPSSTLGYSFPKFMDCGKLANAQEKILAKSTASINEYYQERLNMLTVSGKENIAVEHLKGSRRAYLNLETERANKLVAVKEVRISECKLRDVKTSLDEHFVSVVNQLPPLNTSDEVSVSEWKVLLHSYGTHVVSKSYGGGCYQGTMTSAQNVTISSTDIQSTLNSIVTFENVNAQTENTDKSLAYQFHPASVDSRARDIHQLNTDDREQVLNGWKNSLNVHFETLLNELDLLCLSQVIGAVNNGKTEDATKAINLMLRGALKTTPTSEPSHDEESVTDHMQKARDQTLALKEATSDKLKKQLGAFNDFITASRSDRSESPTNTGSIPIPSLPKLG